MSLAAPGPETRVYRPAELNREVRLHIEAGFPRLWLSGEISNLARPPSGHLYFTLKDQRAQIRCALFKGNAMGMGFRPENGMQVLVRGRLSLYEPRGDYQLIADGMLETGAGALAQAFEALKKKLETEGLFDEAHKRPLPRWPERISVVTSPSGAAVRDILQTLERRWPRARVRIYPSQVQGEAAPAELIRALRAADRQGFGQVILLARGGGSLEDLWAFNDEGLARAIHECATPVVSGVGHETDFTIADFVADHRAPTPTAAAVAATPDGPELLVQLGRSESRLTRAIEQTVQRQTQRLDHADGRLRQQHPERRLDELSRRQTELSRRNELALKRRLETRQRQLQGLESRLLARHPRRQLEQLDLQVSTLRTRLVRAATQSLERREQQVAAVARSLNNVSPLAVLERGYAVIRDPEGQAMTERNRFIKGKKINILMDEFELDAEVVTAPRDASLE
ncbi:exodeoxyribonuclease VII large subunit [Wenzhouxiangella sediminis]|uniref:Exodeoxyribonuclease 7 large subunit n=1 Tax=Wenzhouxiangella sediminis TaxID=1792836 RepID=A0A3E1K5M3_9GAMM|nr:exodeoxyribonuclease VII large subunit [Wenzhouxiangella sediminis]RFF29258.1 exodeoxyribonuclease VII large subunit [Wenzhouxiangella sediminis]